MDAGHRGSMVIESPAHMANKNDFLSIRPAVNETSVQADTLSDLSVEDRARYLRFWKKFRVLDRLGWLAWGVFYSTMFLASSYQSDVSRLMLRAALLLGLVTSVWIRLIICPRCGVGYWGGLLTLLGRFPNSHVWYVSKCYGCDLRREELARLEN